MVKARSGVPRGYQAVMPYLRLRDAARAIRFYKKVFGATERYRLTMGGKIGHAELDLGGSTVMLSDEFPAVNAVGPKVLKGTSVLLTVYVENVDRLVTKAVKAGAKVLRPATDQFYGDRTAQIEDPFGHVWSIQSRIEKVSPKEMQKRLNVMLKAEASAAVARRTVGRPAKTAAAKAGAAAGTARKAAAQAAPAKKARAKTTAAPRKAASRKKAGLPQKAAAKKAVAKTTTRRAGGTGRGPGRPRKTATA
jgi:PhnB protein